LARRTSAHRRLFFSSNKKKQVAAGAADAVLGLSATTDGAQTLLTKAAALLPALLRLGCANATSAAAAEAALGALVNLAQDPDTAASLRGDALRAIPRCMDALRDDDDASNEGGTLSLRAERRLGLLANLTADPSGAAALLAPGGSAAGGAANLARLLGAFLSGGPGTDAVAPLLTNVTGTAAGRALLVGGGDGGEEPLAGGLAAAAAQLVAPGASAMRRGGCAAALRNCCVAAAQAQADAEEEEEEEEGGEEVGGGNGGRTAATALAAGTAAMGCVLSPDVLRPALVALCGALPALAADGDGDGDGGGENRRPPDAEESVREALAEAVLALAGTAPGRAALWGVGAPEALRVAYADEEGAGVCEAMEKTARLFLDNAGGVEEVEEEEKEEGGGGCGGAGGGGRWGV
jgi:hypothetical protein